jgi:deazaflavin-dependent oxidoreductase (nitroreductase family)
VVTNSFEKVSNQVAQATSVPGYVRFANVAMRTMLRSGLPMKGYGGAKMYMLTVRGRKSGEPRSTPIAVMEQDGNRYLFAPFGVVDWVRNIRAAGVADLVRGRQVEHVRAEELSVEERALLIRWLVESGNQIGKNFGVPAGSSIGAYEAAAQTHPVFRLVHIG